MKVDAINTGSVFLPISNVEQFSKPTKTFGHWLMEQLGETNGKLLQADEALQQLASGKAASLHQVMLKLEEAKLSFQLLDQVRTRLMSAYQELMREQI